MPLFANWGQVLQLIVAVVSLGFVLRPALLSMAASNYFSVGAIVFYLLVASVLVSCWLVIKSFREGRKSEQQAEASGLLSWIAPLLYGLGVTVGLYVLFVAVGNPTLKPLRNDNDSLELAVTLPGHSPEVEPTLTQALNSEQLTKLRWEFLSIPRPCVFKITAPPENMALRKSLVELISGVGVRTLGQTRETIEACSLSLDEKDLSPDLYPDQLSYAPPGIVIVNTLERDTMVSGFIAYRLRNIVGLKARTGNTLPPNSPENLIYIQIGTGSLRD